MFSSNISVFVMADIKKVQIKNFEVFSYWFNKKIGFTIGCKTNKISLIVDNGKGECESIPVHTTQRRGSILYTLVLAQRTLTQRMERSYSRAPGVQ